MLGENDVGVRLLDTVAVHFGRALRTIGLGCSPAEVIEIRRVLALVGGGDLGRLRTALRSVSVKYEYERGGFETVFDAFFIGDEAVDDGPADLPHVRGLAGELPDELDWDDEFEGAARMIGADEHTAEIGDLMVDDPEARERNAESAHREENDFSVSSGAEELQVDTDSSRVSGGVTYTIEIDNADAAQVGELTGTAARVAGSELSLVDAADLLSVLDSTDGRSAYGVDGMEDLDDARRQQVQRALEDFMSALTERLAENVLADGELTGPSHVHRDQADIDRACHRLVQRMRGAPRPVSRLTDGGRLDVRSTMRAAAHTDGVPAELWKRVRVPGQVRLLVLVDVSLSVRPVAGFILRLAQTLHRQGSRCEVIAFVDRAVRVTPELRVSEPDTALAEVLAADGLDLSATSDYGRVWQTTLDDYGDLITRRTSVLVVGDGRSNAFDPRVDLFETMARRAHRVAWLTPEPSRYWTQTGCSLAEYGEHCSGVVSARDAAEMMDKCDELGSALR
ncbi:VWA domain-containing protein [Gordonia sp. HY002]|uniref:MadC family VWA domain-containing protein n=1 Tax=Gordonia zhenghanii TaxID=2911516 RepID=UPI001F398163|nr:VWA domain-containing protein [Gordonia zhenghanii]MCF8570645.1 VWA domain-containing protein [Gordonia zhenghanii]